MPLSNSSSTDRQLEHTFSTLALDDNQQLKPKTMELQKIRPYDGRGDQTTDAGREAENKRIMDICHQFIKDINLYGIAVLDSLLGAERGELVYQEVIALYQAGLFTEGQLVRNASKNKDIRGDEILWFPDDRSSYCRNIMNLIWTIDQIVMKSNIIPHNGELGKYKIKSRTKAMIACYPGNGSHYVKHVDNPNGDGRVLTAIYYLNKNWKSESDGGVLHIFPNDNRNSLANIIPSFDRMIFFWSDRRNAHEVQPAYRTRYAITLWYYNSNQKAQIKDDNEHVQC